ncbi:InlB B-repeat-containing protein [Erysipelothrix anatis]|uniref:InlB B-repeat-containing protein n=1 Tax=Erysipelothrix anatis TaxID=2683713 RepID=UPI00135811FB|nr:InlB B-repeat-containing protein [Erysipelothrix anatis]
MKKVLSISLVVLLYIMALPIGAEVRPGSDTYSKDILDVIYATARDNQDEGLLVDDEAVDEYVKLIHTVGPSYHSVTDQKTYYIFDYKGIDRFDNLAELTLVIDLGTMGETGIPKKISNLTVLPQDFYDNDEAIYIFAGEYSPETGTYEQLGDTYWGDPDPTTAKTLSPETLKSYKATFVAELVALSKQYTGERVSVYLDEFDVLLENLNWMAGLNRNLNYEIEAEMPYRFLRRLVRIENVNDTLYYAITIQDENIPYVIRKNGNMFQQADGTQKTVGIDLENLVYYIDDTLGDGEITEIPFTVTATLADGRTFEADRSYFNDDAKNYDDERYTFFFDFESDDSIVGSIERIDLMIAKLDLVTEQLTMNSELYEAYDHAAINDIGSYMETDFYEMDKGLVLHSYAFNGSTINQDENVIKPTYLAAFDQKYDVHFETHGGDPVAPVLQVYVGTHITKPSDPQKQNAIFKGWFTDETFTTPWNFEQNYVEKSITLHAKWEQIAVDTYDVTFESNGGTAVAPQPDLAAGAKVVKPSDPTRSGFTFAGWYTSPTFETLWDFDTDTVQNTMTLYAKWHQNPIVNTFDVTFESNGGTAVAPQPDLAAGAKVVKPSDPTRSGFTFAGWYTSPTFETLWDFNTDTVQNTMTLYAKWHQNPIVNTFDVTFESNGGTAVTPQLDLEAGAKVVKPNDPTRSGFTFVGWYTIPTFETLWDFNTDTVQNTMTLYAKWHQNPIINTFDVTFESNGGTAVAPQLDLEAGAKVVKPSDPTRSGFTFAGWYTSPTFETLWDFDTDTVQNTMILYAKWNQEETVLPATGYAENTSIFVGGVVAVLGLAILSFRNKKVKQ